MSRLGSVVVALVVGLAGASGAAAQDTPPQIPGLQVVCVGCRLKPPVTRMIVRTYEESAEYDGYEIDRSTHLQLRITEVAERDPTAASLFGLLAGFDRLKGTIEVGGATVEVEESTGSTFGNLESVAESVGTTVYKRVAAALKKK